MLQTETLPTMPRWGSGVTALLAAAAACVLLAAVAVPAHLQRACQTRDTPYLPICPETPPPPEVARAGLEERVQRNPGDAGAWTRLLVATPAQQAGGPQVLAAATVLAPNHPNVLRLRAAAALQEGRLQEGVDLLVQMLRTRGTPQAGQALAQLVASGEGVPLLRPHLSTAGTWMPKLLGRVTELKVPPTAVLPLVAEIAPTGTLPAAWLRHYLQLLVRAGQWHDAYGLWLLMHKGSLPLIYNAGFDRHIDGGTFDWQFVPPVRTRTGALVEQVRLAGRGLVLEMQFTGRRFPLPIVRQYIVAAPQAYVLKGEYAASKLRSERGLAWRVVCPYKANAVVATSAPMEDTGNVWRPFELGFTLPPDCGPVASLQLEPLAAFEAMAGMRGRFAVDGLVLHPEEP